MSIGFFLSFSVWSISYILLARVRGRIHSFLRFDFFSMVSSPPTVLILGHSFVRRLSSDLRSNFDAHAAEHFNLLSDAE